MSKERIYKNMKLGIYDVTFLSLETGHKEIGIDAKQVKKACKEEGIDYNKFLEYARNRRGKEGVYR